MSKFDFVLERRAGAMNYGQDIDVKVSVKSGEDAKISDVKVSLNGSVLNNGESALNPPGSHYQHEFRRVGDFTPGKKHKVVVTVSAVNGADNDSATLRWDDGN